VRGTRPVACHAPLFAMPSTPWKACRAASARRTRRPPSGGVCRSRTRTMTLCTIARQGLGRRALRVLPSGPRGAVCRSRALCDEAPQTRAARRRRIRPNTSTYAHAFSLGAALGHATHTLVQQTHDAARRVHYVRTAMRNTAAETQQRRGLPCRAYRRPSKGTDNRNNGTDKRNKGTDNRNKGTDNRNKGTDNRAYRRRSPQSDAARSAPSSGRGRACALRCPLRSTTSGAD
jgi:hypothetical protein